MEATQLIEDSILESEEEETEEDNENKRGEPLAKLRVLKNAYIPETELPLYLGDNVLGRDPNICTLPLSAPSVSKQHTTINISVYRGRGHRGEVVLEALVWDLGSMNGTRRGRFKLTPHVRYALSEGDNLVVADIPCQYVSYTVDKMSGQGDMRTPVNRNSVESTRRSDVLTEKRCDTSAHSAKCVNGGTKASAVVSSPDQQETTKTPARTKCLSFERTPTEPQCTLVPESDCDSDGEKGGGRGRQEKTIVSDSDSHISSPTCSSFLSPTNRIIPESEDESPIMSSSSTKNSRNKSVSFSKEAKDMDVGRQQLKKKRAQVIVDDSDEEEGREEERAAPGGRQPEGGGEHAPAKQENNVSPSRGNGLPVSTPAVSTDAMPVFNMDSDTDVEGEEEVAASPVTLNATPQASHSAKQVQFHMDSDTDVDEDDDKVTKTVPASHDSTKPLDSVPVVQPKGVSPDSDTDVDDDADAAVSDAAAKATPTSHESAHTADSAPSTQQKKFHLDSDTDADEEEENDGSKIDLTPSGLGLKRSGVESTSAAPHNQNLDSDTDDEVIPIPASSKLPVSVTDTKPPTTADTAADLDILSDSDTDVEEDEPLLPPVVTATNAEPSSAKAQPVSLSSVAVTMSTALQSEYDADTDVDEPSVPPAGEKAVPDDFRLDSDTDVEEEKEEDSGEAGEGQMLGLSREKPSQLPTRSVPPLQKCSTPLQLSDVQEDEDFVVAETQSFVLENRDRQGSLTADPTLDSTRAFGLESSSGDEKNGQSSRGGSFKLGLSDSSYLLPQAQALAMESTQAFVSVDGNANMEETQEYETTSPSESTSAEKDLDLETTQAYGADEESARSSTQKASQADFALEATQAYIPVTHSHPEDDTEGEDTTNIATAETQPLGFLTPLSLAMAETQPMSAFEEEENPMKGKPHSSVRRGKQKKKQEREEDEEATQPQEVAISTYLSTAETQPMTICEDEDSEDIIPAPRKRKAKALRLEEEETQSMTSSQLSAVETQPIAICEDEEGDSEDVFPAPRHRKAKVLRLEDETQSMTSSQLSAVETQPIAIPEDEESDSEDVIPAPRQRKAKVLQLEDETQPMYDGDNDSGEDEKGTKAPPPRTGRSQAHKQKGLTSTLMTSSETQPIDICDMDEEEKHEEEDTKAGLSKTKKQPQRGKGRESEAGTSSSGSRSTRRSRAIIAEEEEQQSSDPPKGQTRGKGKALSTTRRRRGQIMPEEEEEEEGDEKQEVEQPKQGRGRRTRKHQKDDSGDEERLETERKEQAEKDRLLKEQEEERTRRALKEQEEKERLERELREERERLEKERRLEQEKLEKERKEKEEQERLEREKAEREEKERLEREEKARIERERKEQEEKERQRIQKEREEQERLERERKEKEEQERLEREKAEREEKERLEREEKARIERERREQEEKERQQIQKEREEQERLEKERKEEQERLERERKKKEEQERLEREKAEREERERLEREEKARIEKERREQEEKERQRIQKEKEEQERLARERKEKEEQERLERERKEEQERLERERKKKEEQERLEREKAEREEKERLEKEEKARIEKERREKEEKERQRIQKEKEEQERLERERKEEQERLDREKAEREEKEKLEREKQEKERLEKEAKEKLKKQQENKDEENNPKAPTRGRRAARRTIADPSTAELEPEQGISTSDDVPARRTRSRSNSSNSVSSERSVSSVTTQERRGRGRGRGAKKTTNVSRETNRRKTVAGETSAEREAAEQDSNDIPPPGVLSRSNSANSLNSEISSCSVSSQNRGRGGRGRGRGRKTDSIPPSDESSAPKATARGRGRKAEGPSNDVSQIDSKETADSKQPSTTRGQKRAGTDNSEPAAADEEDQPTQEEESVIEDSVVPKRNVRGRGQKATKGETLTTSEPAAVSDRDEAKGKGKGKGRKRELEEEAEEDESSGSRGKAKAQEGRRAEEGEKEETEEENPVPIPTKKRGRASTVQGRKNAKETPPEVEAKEESKKVEEIAEKKPRGRQSVAHKKKEEKQEACGTSALGAVNQDASAETSELPQTPASSASRKRAAPAETSPVAKTPRSSSASPAVSGQAAKQVYKVLFTGVVDESGEKVVARLGGSLAKGVADMTFLVTDKVRRTVKFLCAVAKGVPIVTTRWLEKSGKAGSFLPPNAFIVKDAEQEKKFNFCLQESLRTACSQPLLQGYEIHVTKSVKPEPAQMKDIISCSGAIFLPKMPSSHKAQTVVISCEEDRSLCSPAFSASLPVVTAEFILTGILQQKLDFETHALPAPAANLQSAGARGKGRKRT